MSMWHKNVSCECISFDGVVHQSLPKNEKNKNIHNIHLKISTFQQNLLNPWQTIDISKW